ncbi:MAG: hypothetical protein IPK92_12505 [Nitrospira sp.]|nr:hypothetical protein [Nitrospira sp.]
MSLLGVSLLGLAWLAWSSFRRQLYLQGIRTDQEIEERFLTDPHPVSIEPSPLVVRRASRILRQRYAGQRETLDVRATLYATIKIGGALAPRFRAIGQTPEYVALIDQRHRADHLTTYSEALVATLERHGVTVQRYYFDRSPQAGCWRQRVGLDGSERFDRTTFAELAARCTGQRLLVFAEAEALTDEGSGCPQKWTTDLRSFPQRAWLTPMPLGSWGPTEQLVDEQGFLILPLQPESLNTVADWFAAGQLGLDVDTDWPVSYPRLIQGEAVAWVVRQVAPPPDVQDELLFQLRNYLGAGRFQWLCACAIFPAISPPITLKLGHELVITARELALGAVAIGALPWFRWGFMPAWLRQALIDRLDAAHEARFRQIVEAQLDSALESSTAPPLVTIAQRRRSAWFHRCQGVARDIVLVEFLHRNHLTRLAQWLPEGLRKRLFRHGIPAYGLSRELLVALPLCLLVGLTGLPGVWEQLASTQQVPQVQPVAVFTGHSDLITWHSDFINAARFSPDGTKILTTSEDRTTSLWDVSSGKLLTVFSAYNGLSNVSADFSNINDAQFSPNGTKVITASGDKVAHLWEVPSGNLLRTLTGHTGTVTDAQFSPDGTKLVTASGDNTARLWEVPSGNLLATLTGHTAFLSHAQFSPDGTKLVTASGDNTARLWEVPSGNLLRTLTGHHNTIQNTQFSPDGTKLVTASDDNTARLWEVPSGNLLATLTGHINFVINAQFSPDGTKLVTASDDNTARLWEVPSGNLLATLTGHTNYVFDAQFSPDSTRVVTASYDNTARLWEASFGKQLARFTGHSDIVWHAQFSPDGAQIITASNDRTARLWGQPSLPKLDLIDCETEPGVTDWGKQLADQLAKADLRRALAPVAYHPKAWKALNSKPLPASGTVLYPSPEDDIAAQEIANWLTKNAGSKSLDTMTPWKATHDSTLPPHTFIANLCATPSTKEQPVATTQTADIRPFRAFAYYRFENKRYFKKLQDDPAAKPVKGDIVEALGTVNARKEYWAQNRGLAPVVGTIRQGERVRVLDVRDVTDGGGFMWIEFERIASTGTPEQIRPSGQQQLLTPKQTSPTESTQSTEQTSSIRPFHGFAYFQPNSKRYFKKLRGDPAASPVKGDIVEALTTVNAQQGYMDLYGNRPPVIGAIQPGDRLRVLGVKDVTEGNGYIWIEFEKLTLTGTRDKMGGSPQEQLLTPEQANHMDAGQ